MIGMFGVGGSSVKVRRCRRHLLASPPRRGTSSAHDCILGIRKCIFDKGCAQSCDVSIEEGDVWC